jgi:hypothetical protein
MLKMLLNQLSVPSCQLMGGINISFFRKSSDEFAYCCQKNLEQKYLFTGREVEPKVV